MYAYITTLKWCWAVLVCLLLTRWTRTTSSSNAVYQDADASAALSYVGSAGWQGGGGMQWVTPSTCRRQVSARPLHHISFLFFLCLIPRVNQWQTAYWGMEQPLWTLAEDIVTSHSKQIARNRKQARDSWSSPSLLTSVVGSRLSFPGPAPTGGTPVWWEWRRFLPEAAHKV